MSVRQTVETPTIKQNHDAIDSANFVVGATVSIRETGELATVKYSTFGVKVGGITVDGMHWKTNGYPAEEMAKYWEVVVDD